MPFSCQARWMFNKYSNFFSAACSFVSQKITWTKDSLFISRACEWDAKKRRSSRFDEGTIKFFINFRHRPIFRETSETRRRGKEIAFHRFALFVCNVWILIWVSAIYVHCILFRFSKSWRFNRAKQMSENEDIDQRGLIFTTQNTFSSVWRIMKIWILLADKTMNASWNPHSFVSPRNSQ